MIARLKTLSLCTFLFTMGIPVVASAQGTQPRDWPGPWHMWGGWGFWSVFPLLMMILMIGFFAFVMLRAPWGHGHSNHDNVSSALQLLNERFARGEISKEEFEEKRAILVRRA
jgi:putative membrane protein